MDNVFRFVQAGSEVSGLLGRLPSRVGYQPTLATEVAALHERIASVSGVSVTAIEAVYVPADDFTDPAVTAISSHLDSMIVLSRSMAAEGMYPAVDPLSSSSILLDPTVVGEKHYRIGCGAILDLMRDLPLGSKHFPCPALPGVCDKWAESSLYMVGTIDGEGLREEAQQPASPRHNEAIAGAQFLNPEKRDDVLQFLVMRDRLAYLFGTLRVSTSGTDRPAYRADYNPPRRS
jgi:hypothetical protein